MTKATSARVRLAAAAALVCILGLGPAVAWDMTSQPPRAKPRSPWASPPSPWKVAGLQMKDSARAMAKVYLPPRAEESSSPPSTGAPTTLPTAVATVAATAVPTIYRGIPHPSVLRGIALE
jgi:hypothetical protein